MTYDNRLPKPAWNSAGSQATQSFEVFDRLLLPNRLDRLADAELQLGHHAAAERLASVAAELRAAQS